MTDTLDVFNLTTDTVAKIIETEPEPRAPTPCPDWDYAELLAHLVGGDRLFARILTGQPRPQKTPQTPRGADEPALSADDYRSASRRLAELFADEAVLDSVHQIPVGALRGRQIVVLRSVEHLLHGWDLAKAAGASTRGLEPAAAALQTPALRLLDAVGQQTLASRRPFGTAVETVPDATDLDRLVAAFGRDPGWQPDPEVGYASLKERFASHDDVELPDGSRRGYGADGMRVAGAVFACSYQGRLMIKLPSDDVAELIESGVGRPLAKPGQRPVREWVLVPFDGAAGRRAERAYGFVRTSSA